MNKHFKLELMARYAKRNVSVKMARSVAVLMATALVQESGKESIAMKVSAV